MRGEKILKILELLEEAAFTTLEISTAIVRAGYGASISKINKKAEELPFSKISIFRELRHHLEEKKKLSKLISKLKQDGLLVKSKKNKKLVITAKGRNKLVLLRRKQCLGHPKIQSDDKIKIIIFDIPEQKRHQRDWLRCVLRRLDFKMLQKSVWIGTTKIPEDFLKELNNIGLLIYVEIFEISKRGTLKQIT